MSTYTAFTREQIEAALPGGWTEAATEAGNELVVEQEVDKDWTIYCYTGISLGSAVSREAGSDAIRFVLIDAVSGKPAGKTVRVHRTGTVKSLAARFAERVAELEAVAAREQPLRCKRCGAATAERKNGKTGDVFRGCVQYKTCKESNNDAKRNQKSNGRISDRENRTYQGDQAIQGRGQNRRGDIETTPSDHRSELHVAPSVEQPTGPVQHDGQSRGTGGLAAALTSAPKRHPPTAEQAAIIAAAKAGHRVIVVQAGAGTGKTSTQVMVAEALPGKRGQYTSFVRALVDDAKGKFPSSCDVAGVHQLAFRAVGFRYKHRLNTGRVKAEEVARRLGIGAEELNGKRLAPGFLAAQVLGAVRRFCQSDDAEVKAEHFRYIDGIDQPDGQKRTWANNNWLRAKLLPFAARAWGDMADVRGTLPFTHDAYVKIWELGNPVISCDYLLADEVQDLSPVMLSIFRKQAGCKMMVLVGDSAQQIFEWRGAVDALKTFPDVPTLFLSQSFRFGQAIADVANAVLATLEEPTALRLKGLPSIQSKVITQETKRGTIGQADQAGRGVDRTVVARGRPANDGNDSSVGAQLRIPGTAVERDQKCAVLTRTNACAVATLLNSMTQGKRPFLVGGGADVIAFVEGAKALKEGRGTSHPELACFANWAEVEEYSKQEDGEDLRLMCKLIKEFGCNAILRALRSMPPEDQADLIISTAHKSKGREWDYVRLASDFKVQSKCDDAERKLLYVAVTRAKLILDVSCCPFFTGQDSLGISKVVSNERKQGERDEGGRDTTVAQRKLPNGDKLSSSDGTQAPIRGGVPTSGAAGQATQEANNDEVTSQEGAGERRPLVIPAQSPLNGKVGGSRPGQQGVTAGETASFTWTRFRDDWMIRGPKGHIAGEQVTVERKNGSKSKERLGAAVWENGDCSIYRVFR